MADKVYIDAEGVKQIKKYFDTQIDALIQAIALLYESNETPGSIQQMIEERINQLRIEDIDQDEEIIIYGGNAR